MRSPWKSFFLYFCHKMAPGQTTGESPNKPLVRHQYAVLRGRQLFARRGIALWTRRRSGVSCR